jgi:hypothetical protein
LPLLLRPLSLFLHLSLYFLLLATFGTSPSSSFLVSLFFLYFLHIYVSQFFARLLCLWFVMVLSHNDQSVSRLCTTTRFLVVSTIRQHTGNVHWMLTRWWLVPAEVFVSYAVWIACWSTSRRHSATRWQHIRTHCGVVGSVPAS